jgi:hypothetical protein
MLPTMRRKEIQKNIVPEVIEDNPKIEPKTEVIKEETHESKLLKLIEEGNKRQAEILEIVKEMRKPKQETRQEVINPSKTDEQVAAELLLSKKEKEK